jgi:hypothetical protein
MILDACCLLTHVLVIKGDVRQRSALTLKELLLCESWLVLVYLFIVRFLAANKKIYNAPPRTIVILELVTITYGAHQKATLTATDSTKLDKSFL